MSASGDGAAPAGSGSAPGGAPSAPVASQSALPTPPQLLQPTGGSTVGGLGSSLPPAAAAAAMLQSPQQQQQPQNFPGMSYQQQSVLQNVIYQQKQMRNSQRLMVPPQAPRGSASAAGNRPSAAAAASVYHQQAAAVASSPATSMQQQLAQRMQQQQQQQRPQQMQNGGQQQQQMQAAARSSVYSAQANMNVQYMQQGMRPMAQPQVPVHPSMLNGQPSPMQARQKQAQTGYQPGAMQGLQMMSNLRPQGMIPAAQQRAQTNLRPQQLQQPQQIQQQQLAASQRMQGTPVQRAAAAGYQLQSPMQQQWTNKQTLPGQYQGRPPQMLTPQQQFLQQQQLRAQFAGTQRPPMLNTSIAAGTPPAASSTPEPTNRILGKRSIQELVAQVDSREKLEPEVEDALLEIADDFIETVTTFACALAKHRKSTVLEAKDVLLHLERNWQINLPGFGGDEYKTYKKPVPSEPHKQRLAVVKKSLSIPEAKASKLQQQQQAAPSIQSPGPRLG